MLSQNLIAWSEAFAGLWPPTGAAVITDGAPDPNGGTLGGQIAACVAGQGMYIGAAVDAPAFVAGGAWIRCPNATPGSPAGVGLSDAFGSTGGVTAEMGYSRDGVWSASSSWTFVDGFWSFVTFWQTTASAGQLGPFVRLSSGATQPLQIAFPRLSYGRTPSSYVRAAGAAVNAARGASRGLAVGRGVRPAMDGLSFDERPLVTAASNLWARSEDLNVAPWIPNGLTVAGPVAGPGGSGSAWALQPSVAMAVHFVSQGPTLEAGADHSFSLVVRPVGSQWVIIADNGTNYAQFDCATGAVSYVGNARDGRVESLGDGWYRLSFLLNPALSGDARIYTCDAAGNVTFIGDGSTAFEATQASIVARGRGPYVKTAAAAISTSGRLLVP